MSRLWDPTNVPILRFKHAVLGTRLWLRPPWLAWEKKADVGWVVRNWAVSQVDGSMIGGKFQKYCRFDSQLLMSCLWFLDSCFFFSKKQYVTVMFTWFGHCGMSVSCYSFLLGRRCSCRGGCSKPTEWAPFSVQGCWCSASHLHQCTPQHVSVKPEFSDESQIENERIIVWHAEFIMHRPHSQVHGLFLTKHTRMQDYVWREQLVFYHRF